MLVENPYPEDTRVRNEATLLQSVGYDVSVIALRTPNKPRWEVLDGVKVYRLPHIELFKKTVAERPGMLGRILLKLTSFAGYAF